MANKLEAILLLTTSREIDNGQFAKFLCQFEGMSKTSLSLVINVNNYTHTTDIESLINHYFKVVIRPMMYVALTYDHRLIDGREAVTFLRKIKSGVEDPRTLLLD